MMKIGKLTCKAKLVSAHKKCLHTSVLLFSTECNASPPKPFEEIPSPPKGCVPFFGHGVLLVKKPAGMEQMWKNIEALKEKYVPPGVEMLRLYIPVLNGKGKGRVLHLFDVEDIREVFHHEGKYPTRIDLSSFQKMRERRPDIFGVNPGLLSAEGEEWQSMRSKVQQDMMRPKAALFYIDKLQDAAEDFVGYIKRQRNNETKVIDDFIPASQRYALEGITLITLDTRMGCLDENPHPELQRIIDANDLLINQFIKLMTSFPIWNYVPPRWSKVFRVVEDCAEIASTYINTKVNAAAQKCKETKSSDIEHSSLLEKLILKNGFDSGIPKVMALDALLGGIDTTGNTLSFLLYLLAKNPDKQELLRSEIASFGHERLTAQDVSQMRYFRACQQESFRLLPTTNGGLRTIQSDATIRGYNVPAGTAVMWSFMLIGKDPKMFPDPESFKPERWLDSKEEIHPLAVRPFGIGPRMCIGKRFAELEILVGIAKLVQNFRIEWAAEYDSIEQLVKTVNVPNKNLSFRFVDIK